MHVENVRLEVCEEGERGWKCLRERPPVSWVKGKERCMNEKNVNGRGSASSSKGRMSDNGKMETFLP